MKERTSKQTHTPTEAPAHHAWDRYWLWHGMFSSYKSLKQSDTHNTEKRRLSYLKKQIVLQYIKNFFFYPIWLVRLLTPSYLKGDVNIWTNLKTIITNREFRPLRLAVLSQMAFLFFLAQFGVTVFYKHATPALGATYQWVQTDWSGGVSTSTSATHGSNQTGWNTFFSKDPAVQVDQAGEITVLGSADTYTETSAADFGAGVLSNVSVNTSTDSITLTQENTGSEPIETATFNYTGAVQTYTVPDGVTAITVKTYGAEGGDGNNGNSGGQGGYATGQLSVTPGETLYLYVGQAGASNNSSCSQTSGARFNGGGAGNCAASGGGASDIRQGGTALTDRVIVAGGGGGSAFYLTDGGAGGGLTGADGDSYPSYGTGGGGGTQSAGGTGGSLYATAGSLGTGGTGGSTYGGGGGGGYYGGGGGGGETTGQGRGGAGGGGSSYIGGVTDGTTTAGVQSGNGQIILSSASEAGSGSEESGGEEVTETFSYSGSIDSFTVPDGVTSITVQAKGGQGASGYSGTVGGLGADMTGTFTVTPGDTIQILVGGQGLNSPNNYSSGSGGGGTFVYNATTAELMVAAGGGGGSSRSGYGTSAYTDASAGTSGHSGSASGAGAGGTNGNGGGGGSYSAGGAGWNSNGSNASYSSGGKGGYRFLAGGAGGLGRSGYGANGAFGGGGGVYAGASGGGGYSGGGSGGWSYGWGGGGGSYNGGSDQTNVGGSNSGAGEVVLTYVTASSGSDSSNDQTETFDYTGSMQTFTVPNGVTSVTVQAYGAEGGRGYNAGYLENAGKGAYITGELAVTPGETLNIYVGGEGGENTCCSVPTGGWNGGGNGGAWSSSYTGGGGGGASDIRIGGTALSDRVLVAGGGGGGSYYVNSAGGVGGYPTGGDGTHSGSADSYGGKGGTQSAGGAAATSNRGSYPATAGTLGQGGRADYSDACPGGGGGGYYGGGGGGHCNGGGGGGGSSYIGGITDASTSSGVRSGNGQIIISYVGYEVPTVTDVSIVGTSSVQILWDAVDDISYYTVSSTVGDNFTTTDTSYTFTGLSTSTEYSFQVATNLSGFSSATTTQIYRGSYTSPIVDATSAAQFSTISWNDTTPTSSVIIMEVRTGAESDLSDGTWTTVTNEGSLGDSLDGKRYFQYRAWLLTSDADNPPSVEDVTISYEVNSGSFISSPYDTSNANNLLGSIAWEATTSTGDVVKFQLRSSPDGSTWTDWMGTDGTSDTYFTAADGSDDMPDALGDGSDDRWVQYKAFLTDDGEAGLTLDEVTLTYVVNEAPEVQNVTAEQNADGTVSISYEVRDTDSLLGATPGTILPTVEYWNGASWVEASTFSEGATSSKAVNTSDLNQYTEYALTWYPNDDYDEQYMDADTGKIRVKANDSEAANNIGSGESDTFILDTKAPVSTSFVIDARSDTDANVTLAATDDTESGMLIKMSNNSNLSADGINPNSGTWVAYDTSFDWALVENPSTIYYQFKDAYNNISEIASTHGPDIPQNVVYRDISNADTSEWREFVAWETVSAPDAGFAQYNIYRKVDSGDFELLATETTRTVNYYIDTGLSSGSTYSYKITAQDDDGNISNYSSTVTDAPDGQGGSDFTSPTITNVSSTDVGPQTATITWDTDEPANSTVEYITEEGGDFSSAESAGIATMLDTSNGLGQHQVVLTGLTPSTTYYFRVKSTDPSSNTVTDKEGVNGYTFTTTNGPQISSVSVSNIGNTEAVVNWQTNNAANSYVHYSTSSAFTTSVQTGSVNETTRHAIRLTDLTANTRYYYYVSSGGTTDKHVIDGEVTYYNFVTTNDVEPPVITFVSASDITNLTDTSVTISWSTDKPTASTLDYGTDSAFGTTLSNSHYNTNHTYTIAGLTLGTSYYVRLLNTDENSNQSEAEDFVFTTTDSTDVTAPVISSVTTTLRSDTKAVITWATNEGSSSQVFYGTAEDDLSSSTTIDTASNLRHTVILSDLDASTAYYYVVKSADANGNVSTSSPAQYFTTLQSLSEEDSVVSREAASYQEGYAAAPKSGGGGMLIINRDTDAIAPTISDPEVTNISDTEATITWSASENSDGIVEYSYLQGRYDNSAIDVPLSDKRAHNVHIYDLSPLTTYYYRVSSEDASNNRSEYKIGSFTTGAQNEDGTVVPGEANTSVENLSPDSAAETYLASLERASEIMKQLSTSVSDDVLEKTLQSQSTVIAELSKNLPPPVISNQAATDVGSTYVTISWLTDKSSNSLIQIASDDVYSGSNQYEQTVGDSTAMVTNHGVTIRGLRPNSLYHYRVISRTTTGLEAVSKDYTFRTKTEVSEITTYTSESTGEGTVVFSWITNVPTDSTITYTPYVNGVPNKNASKVVHEGDYKTNHSLAVTGLEAGSVYDIELSGQDYSNETVTKLIQGFTTKGEDLPPIVYQIQTDTSILPGANNKIQVIVSWMTNEPATSRVLYRKGFSADNAEFEESTSIDQSYIRKHIVVITNFEPGSVYQFQVESTDSAGNATRSKTVTVLTPRQQDSVFQVIMGNFQDVFSWVGKIQ